MKPVKEIVSVPKFTNIDGEALETSSVWHVRVISDGVPERMAPGKNNDDELIFAAGLLIEHPLLRDGSHRIWNEDVATLPEGLYQYLEYPNQSGEDDDNETISCYLALRVAIDQNNSVKVLYNFATSSGHTFGYYQTEKESDGNSYHPTEEFRWNSSEKRFVSINEPNNDSENY